jgi:hypothetical protein
MGSDVHGRALSPSTLRTRDGRLTIGKVLMLAVLAAGVYFLVLLVPPYIENYKFQKELDAMARHSHIEKDDNVLRASIQKEAQTLGIRLLGEHILISRHPNDGGIEIMTEYDRVVNLRPFGLMSMHFKNDAHEAY